MRAIQPVAKRLACGDTGMGAMADVDEIVRVALEALRGHAADAEAALAAGKPSFEP